MSFRFEDNNSIAVAYNQLYYVNTRCGNYIDFHSAICIIFN